MLYYAIKKLYKSYIFLLTITESYIKMVSRLEEGGVIMLLTLKSARINVDLTQQEVVDILKREYHYELTRQKLAEYEKDSSDIPINLADNLAEIYFLSREDIFFGHKSTLSYTHRLKKHQSA